MALTCTGCLEPMVDRKWLKTDLKGLEPFGLARLGRIWGHVGACCPMGLFLGKNDETRDVPNVRNTEALVGRNEEQMTCC